MIRRRFRQFVAACHYIRDYCYMRHRDQEVLIRVPLCLCVSVSLWFITYVPV